MSTFVLKRGYELQLPMSFVDVNRDEMEYVDGGFYISNKMLRAGLCTVMSYGAVNSLTLYGLKVIANTISRVVGTALKWAGTAIGGPVVGIVGWVVGNWSGYALGIQTGRALISGKGLKVSWDGLSVQ